MTVQGGDHHDRKLRQQKFKVSSHEKKKTNQKPSTQTKTQTKLNNNKKNPARSREGQMLASSLTLSLYTIQDPSPGHDATHR